MHVSFQKYRIPPQPAVCHLPCLQAGQQVPKNHAPLLHTEIPTPPNADRAAFPLTLIYQAKIRWQPQTCRLFSHKRQAKSMYRRDTCFMYQKKLAAQTCIVWCKLQSRCNGICKLAAHFRSCCIGIGHQQKLINIQRVDRVSQATNHTFYQYCCLSPNQPPLIPANPSLVQ